MDKLDCNLRVWQEQIDVPIALVREHVRRPLRREVALPLYRGKRNDEFALLKVWMGEQFTASVGSFIRNETRYRENHPAKRALFRHKRRLTRKT
jgi:hypothetical protein